MPDMPMPPSEPTPPFSCTKYPFRRYASLTRYSKFFQETSFIDLTLVCRSSRSSLLHARNAEIAAVRTKMHPNQIQDWRRKLLEQAGQIFERGSHLPGDGEHKLNELHAKIGQLTMERDF